MPDSLLDLLLGSRCAVCERPGRVLCRACREALPIAPATCWPIPAPPGLARPVAVGDYRGALKALVNAHKEEHRFALARPLGDLLAHAVLAHAREARDRRDDPASRDGPARRARPDSRDDRGDRDCRVSGPAIDPPVRVLLVPVPSRGAVVRRRGHDPLLRITTRAAARLRRLGVDATVTRLLRSDRVAEDQAGLGAADRARNLAGSMTCPVPRARRAAPATGPAPLVLVVDDVITTGSTVREAQRALEEAGVPVSGIAVVAATRRTSIGPLDHPVAAVRRGGSSQSRASPTVFERGPLASSYGVRPGPWLH